MRSDNKTTIECTGMGLSSVEAPGSHRGVFESAEQSIFSCSHFAQRILLTPKKPSMRTRSRRGGERVMGGVLV